jgi:Flp pilus assembly protein TadG
MLTFFRTPWKKFCRDEKGVAAVEFALMTLTLVFIIGIIMDFGHYFYLRQVVTQASREGARFGSLYGDPRATTAEIQTFVQQKYGPSLGYSSGSGPSVNVQGAGGVSETDITVTVIGTKSWFFLDSFISLLGNPGAFRSPAGSTTMKLE